MKVVITEGQYNLIQEYFNRKTSQDSRLIAQKIRDCLKSIYEPKGKWGSINDPDNNCKTGEGVINIFPHIEGVDNWSILNRFDTNSLVRNKLKETYISETQDSKFDTNSFIEWLEKNKDKLFDADSGTYVNELVELNKGTIKKGIENEDFAVDVLTGLYPNSKIQRYCSGHLDDILHGMDILIETEGKKINVQVKPYEEINWVYDDTGVFYEIKIKNFDPFKYSESNVDIFFFVNFPEKKYMLFHNVRRKISTYSNFVRFYEDPILKSDNIVFKNKRGEITNDPLKRKYNKSDSAERQKYVKNMFKQQSKDIEKYKRLRDFYAKLVDEKERELSDNDQQQKLKLTFPRKK